MNVGTYFLEIFEGPRDILGEVNNKNGQTPLMERIKFVNYDLPGYDAVKYDSRLQTFQKYLVPLVFWVS